MRRVNNEAGKGFNKDLAANGVLHMKQIRVSIRFNLLAYFSHNKGSE